MVQKLKRCMFSKLLDNFYSNGFLLVNRIYPSLPRRTNFCFIFIFFLCALFFLKIIQHDTKLTLTKRLMKLENYKTNFPNLLGE